MDDRILFAIIIVLVVVLAVAVPVLASDLSSCKKQLAACTVVGMPVAGAAENYSAGMHAKNIIYTVSISGNSNAMGAVKGMNGYAVARLTKGQPSVSWLSNRADTATVMFVFTQDGQTVYQSGYVNMAAIGSCVPIPSVNPSSITVTANCK